MRASEVRLGMGNGSDRSDPSTHVDRSEILTRPTRQNERLRENHIYSGIIHYSSPQGLIN